MRHSISVTYVAREPVCKTGVTTTWRAKIEETHTRDASMLKICCGICSKCRAYLEEDQKRDGAKKDQMQQQTTE
jgi:hypothetical protein